MQNGSIYKRSGAWWLRYRARNADGETVQRAERLADFNAQYRSKATVRPLADEFLRTVNDLRDQRLTLRNYLRDVYMPHCEKHMRPSTRAGYHGSHTLIVPHLDGTMLRDIDPAEIQRILDAVANTPSKIGKPHTRTVLSNVRAFLSGALRHAILNRLYHRANPVQPTSVKKLGRRKQETHAYTPEEVIAMLRVLPEPARTVILTAAFTGLRRGELRAIQWEDIKADGLHVTRNAWGTHIGEPKTAESMAPVPLAAIVRAALEDHRLRTGLANCPYVFHGERGHRPLHLDMLAHRVIRPTLKKAGMKWYGWHAFRRGLATRLNAMAIDDSVIQRILRHSDIRMTQQM